MSLLVLTAWRPGGRRRGEQRGVAAEPCTCPRAQFSISQSLLAPVSDKVLGATEPTFAFCLQGEPGAPEAVRGHKDSFLQREHLTPGEHS